MIALLLKSTDKPEKETCLDVTKKINIGFF